eukprot:c25623_g1_i1 orf=329-1465(+)
MGGGPTEEMAFVTNRNVADSSAKKVMQEEKKVEISKKTDRDGAKEKGKNFDAKDGEIRSVIHENNFGEGIEENQMKVKRQKDEDRVVIEGQGDKKNKGRKDKSKDMAKCKKDKVKKVKDEGKSLHKFSAEKLKGKLAKLDSNLEKILFKKEKYLQILRKIETESLHDNTMVLSSDSKPAIESFPKEAVSLAVKCSTREDMGKVNNVNEEYIGQELRKEKNREVSDNVEVGICASKSTVEEDLKGRRMNDFNGRDNVDKSKCGKENRDKYNLDRSNKKLTKLYSKSERILSKIEYHLQKLNDAKGRLPQQTNVGAQHEPIADCKVKDKDMEILAKEMALTSVACLPKKEKLAVGDEGCEKHEGIKYPTIDEREISGVDY